MESPLETIEFDCLEGMRDDAKRHLARIARGLRYAPETSERRLETLSELQAAADPAVVSRRLLPSITNQPWATA
jgi:hypothetical protein